MMPPLAQQGLCSEGPYYEGAARQPLMPPHAGRCGRHNAGDRVADLSDYSHHHTGDYPHADEYLFHHTEGYPLHQTGDDSPKAPIDPSGEDHTQKVKCVLVGDGAVGKTSLIVSYTTNGYPTEYVPTAFDNYSVVVTVDQRPVRLQLCDTAGQDDFDSLRPLCYPGSDVFLVCFSVVSPTSFHNVREKWLPELSRHWPGAPVLLVGTQSDLRTDVQVLIELAAAQEQPVTEAAAQRLARQIGARAYVESSALTQRNLKEVFDQALLAALEAKNSPAVLNNGALLPPNHRSSFRNSVRRKKSTMGCVGGDGDCDSLASESRGSGWKKLCCIV